MVSAAALTSRPDMPIDEANFLCPREGCGWGVSVQFWEPGWEPPVRIVLPERDFSRKERRNKTDAMLAGIEAMARARDAEFKSPLFKRPSAP